MKIYDEAKKNFLPMQAGDVPATWEVVNSLIETKKYKLVTPTNCGIKEFINRFSDYIRR